MDAKALLARMEAQRASWVDLPDGRRVRIVRPPEMELLQFVAGVRVEHVPRYTIAWDGFTEATLLGASVGSEDPLPFDRDVWSAYVADHIEEAKVVVNALRDRMQDYFAAKAEREKNSPPSSTP